MFLVSRSALSKQQIPGKNHTDTLTLFFTLSVNEHMMLKVSSKNKWSRIISVFLHSFQRNLLADLSILYPATCKNVRKYNQLRLRHLKDGCSLTSAHFVSAKQSIWGLPLNLWCFFFCYSKMDIVMTIPKKRNIYEENQRCSSPFSWDRHITFTAHCLLSHSPSVLQAGRKAGHDGPDRQRKGDQLPEVSHRLSSTRCSSNSRQAV